MKSRFEICIPRVLKHEGGYVDHPRDPGGATNKGITIATFRRFIKPSGTKADLKAMTEAQAVIVYKRQYWDTVSADSLPSGVDHATFDFSVNSGPTRAAKYLQRVVGVPQDGKVGPRTIAACSNFPAEDIINQLCDDRMAFLKRLRHWSSFGRGWTTRVKRVRAEAMSDVGTRKGTLPDTGKAPKVSAGAAGATGAVAATIYWWDAIKAFFAGWF